MQLPFSKYSGLGNDFIFIDNRFLQNTFDGQTIQKLCHRHLGIGADGVVLVENSSVADYKMKIYNCDGREAQMCGNALRCLYLFLEKINDNLQKHYQIETYERLLTISKEKNLIRCEMGNVHSIQLHQLISFPHMSITGHVLNTGVPHFVIFSDELEKVDVNILGEKISHHPFFSPERTNVNFVSKLSPSTIKIRTFERGVEAETLACGTGACAAAIIYSLLYDISGPIKVETCLGQHLTFDFQKDQEQILNLTMLGPAQFIFDGQISLEGFLVNK